MATATRVLPIATSKNFPQSLLFRSFFTSSQWPHHSQSSNQTPSLLPPISISTHNHNPTHPLHHPTKRHTTTTTTATTGSSPSEKRISILPASLNSLGLKYLEADELRAQFDKYDVNRDGYIDEAEAVQLLIDAGVKEEDASGPASREIVHSMISVVPSVPSEGATATTTTTTLAGGSSESSEDSSIETKPPVVGVSWPDFQSAVSRAAEPVSSKIYPISASLLLNYTGQGITWPILPLLARSIGLAPSELGFITGSAALARVLANVPAAALAERKEVGRKPLLVVGPAIGSLGYAGYALGGESLESLVVASAMTGLGGALTSVGAGLFLSDISTPLNRARTMSPLMMTALLGFAVGPALGGVLAEGYSFRLPFVVTALGMGCASLSAMVLLPETLRGKHATMHSSSSKSSPQKDATIQQTMRNTAQQWMQLVQIPSLQGISSISLMNGILQGASPVTTVLFATEILHMTPSQLGIMFGAQILAMTAVIPPATALSDSFRKNSCRSRIILPGMAASALLLGIQPLCTESILAFAGISAVRAVVDALCIMPNVTPFIMDNTTEKERAQALAMRNVSQDVGILVGATSLGMLAQWRSVPEAVFATAGMQVAVAGYFYWKTRGSRKSATDSMEKENKIS